jgi:hypothetical protein
MPTDNALWPPDCVGVRGIVTGSRAGGRVPEDDSLSHGSGRFIGFAVGEVSIDNQSECIDDR